MVIDMNGFIKSQLGNENLTETRDYAITTNHPHEVNEVLLLQADWDRKDFNSGENA
jgi:hypothetical protein